MTTTLITDTDRLSLKLNQVVTCKWAGVIVTYLPKRQRAFAVKPLHAAFQQLHSRGDTAEEGPPLRGGIVAECAIGITLPPQRHLHRMTLQKS